MGIKSLGVVINSVAFSFPCSARAPTPAHRARRLLWFRFRTLHFSAVTTAKRINFTPFKSVKARKIPNERNQAYLGMVSLQSRVFDFLTFLFLTDFDFFLKFVTHPVHPLGGEGGC